MQGYRERVTDVELPHIRALPKSLPPLFAAAARRAEAAGFDGVELHYAHAYTMASFLSRTNAREDGYGGPLEKRLRLPLEVFAAVRASVRPDFVVGCRFLAEECIEGGNELDETPAMGVAFATAGMDFVSTSRGGKFEDAARPAVNAAAYPYTGPSGYECMPQFISDARGPFGRNAAPTRAIRDAIRAVGFRTPVVCTGGVHNFEMAESWLTEGVCDVVGAARQSLADPDWTLKISLGRARRYAPASSPTTARRSIRSTKWLPASSGTSSSSPLSAHCGRRTENDGSSRRNGRGEANGAGSGLYQDSLIRTHRPNRVGRAT
jgi:2,4-dienoyl-CoA reductase-like NADH-dependent reductase (Old Yellow Enzyme family)